MSVEIGVSGCTKSDVHEGSDSNWRGDDVKEINNEKGQRFVV